jgi:hypothetical protein
MAAPSYTEDLTDITLAESTTNWSALGGGASGLAIGPDFAMQGTNCVDKQVTASEKGQVFNNGATITPGANTHFFVWVFLATPGVTNTLANRGLGIVIGTALTAYNTFHVEGSDTYGGEGRVGVCYPIRYVTTANGTPPYRTLTSTPGANPQYFGATANITGTVKSSNLGVDAIRYGTGAYITAGEVANPATFTGFAAQNDNVSNRWGILSAVGGGFELQGRFVVGQNNAGTATLAYFSDSNKVISFVDTPHSLTDFTQVIIDHASTIFNLTSCTFQALGTNNPGRLVFNNASTVSTLTTTTFSGMGISTLRGAVVANGCTWRACGQITANSATITNSNISSYTGASNTSALIWDTNLDPNGYLDGTTFTKGSGTTHAIEFGTTSPTTMTLTDVNFAEYNASNAQNDSAIHIKRTTGTVTINIVDGNTPSYRTDGATVVIVSGSVSVTLKAQTTSGSIVQSASVFVKASDGTGPFPFQDSVTIVNSGTTATVTHTGHGLSTNDKVYIEGASLDANLGVFSITVTGNDTYTYTMGSSPGSSPTGTIISTFVILNGTTDINGEITMSRVFPSDQNFTGWVRKSTSSPYYKTGLVTGTVSSTTGATPIALMILDE